MRAHLGAGKLHYYKTDRRLCSRLAWQRLEATILQGDSRGDSRRAFHLECILWILGPAVALRRPSAARCRRTRPPGSLGYVNPEIDDSVYSCAFLARRSVEITIKRFFFVKGGGVRTLKLATRKSHLHEAKQYEQTNLFVY